MECFTCSASCANIYCTGFFSIRNTILAVKNIPSREYQPGKYTFNWNGKDDNGSLVSSGIYFVSFESKFDTSVKKIAVIR